MSKEQIEEMARIASKCITSWLNNETPKALPDYIAEALYNAGYRKQSENVIELLCKVSDTVYQVDSERIYELEVFGISIVKGKPYYETESIDFG